MRTISELASVLPINTYDAENWLKKLDFRTTRFQPTSQGKARLYTQENAFVLGLMGAMVKGGATPTQAVLLAERVFQFKKMGKLRRWLVFADGNFGTTKFTPSADAARLAKEMGAVTVSLIDIEEIDRRIGELFKAEPV